MFVYMSAKRVKVGIVDTGKRILVIYCLFLRKQPAPFNMASLMKNQGIVPTMRNGKKSTVTPLYDIGLPPLKPIAKANKYTNIVITGFMTAHAGPRAAPL